MSEIDREQYIVREEPYYRAVADEVEMYEAAYAARMPVMLKGPTGCGKSRFVEHMAWKLQKPLITVACNEDMTASDLVGRFLLDINGTRWQDGPLTLAARMGVELPITAQMHAMLYEGQTATVAMHELLGRDRRTEREH